MKGGAMSNLAITIQPKQETGVESALVLEEVTTDHPEKPRTPKTPMEFAWKETLLEVTVIKNSKSYSVVIDPQDLIRASKAFDTGPTETLPM